MSEKPLILQRKTTEFSLNNQLAKIGALN